VIQDIEFVWSTHWELFASMHIAHEPRMFWMYKCTSSTIPFRPWMRLLQAEIVNRICSNSNIDKAYKRLSFPWNRQFWPWIRFGTENSRLVIFKLMSKVILSRDFRMMWLMSLETLYSLLTPGWTELIATITEVWIGISEFCSDPSLTPINLGSWRQTLLFSKEWRLSYNRHNNEV